MQPHKAITTPINPANPAAANPTAFPVGAAALPLEVLDAAPALVPLAEDEVEVLDPDAEADVEDFVPVRLVTPPTAELAVSVAESVTVPEFVGVSVATTLDPVAVTTAVSVATANAAPEVNPYALPILSSAVRMLPNNPWTCIGSALMKFAAGVSWASAMAWSEAAAAWREARSAVSVATSSKTARKAVSVARTLA